MIARDHLYRNTRLAAFRDRGYGFRPRRIDERNKAEQRKSALRILRRNLRCRLGHRPPRQRDHTLPVRRQRLDLSVPELLVEIAGSIFRRRLGAHVSDAFRRTLEIKHRRAAIPRIERRHVAMPRIEGDFIKPREACPRRGKVMPRLDRKRKQRPLHRVAIREPASFPFAKFGIVAKQAAKCELLERRTDGNIDRLSILEKAALRLVAGSFDLHLPLRRYKRAHRHLVLGQRPRLVRTDDGDGAKRLDGRQPPYHRVAPRHALYTHCERNRHHRR